MTQNSLQQEIASNLPHFSGSDQYYTHKTFGYGFMTLTQGAAYIREKCACFWLFDLILSHQYKLRGESFQEWDLSKATNGTWVVNCTDGNGNTLASQDIHFSDFPLDGIVLWLVDNVAMLPSEY